MNTGSKDHSTTTHIRRAVSMYDLHETNTPAAPNKSPAPPARVFFQARPTNNNAGGVTPKEIMAEYLVGDRGYIPKVFAFKNRYPLNPEKSDLFYFLLIRTKRPKLLKLQRAVSSSSALHAIKLIPRDTRTLAFLLIHLQNADSRGMRKSLLKVPTVVDFALTV